MNQKTLIGLVVAALIALVAAIALNHANKPQSEGSGEASEYLAPGLREHINDISKVVVTGAGDKTLATLQRGTKGWSLAEKGGYAVDTGKLREFLLKLSDAQLVERKTANKDKYATLGVEDVSAKDAKGLQVELDGLAQPLKLIVGDPDARGSRTFVRRAGEAQSWLASGALGVEKNAADWLKKDLADIAANRIASVTITHADGSALRVYKDAAGDANFKLADIPKGREAGPEYGLNGLASNLAGLRFDDVLPAQQATSGDKAAKARYAAFDGLVVDVTAWQKDGKDYAQFAASLDAAQADKGIAAEQAKAKADFEAATAAAAAKKEANAADAPIKPLAISDPSQDRDNRLATLNKEVADLKARFDGWVYVLPAYKYANIDKSIDDLLKPLEAKPATKPVSTAAPKSGKSG
ncbi:MAG: DUF4340 domain-containing protein [Lysobacterales bacterium]